VSRRAIAAGRGRLRPAVRGAVLGAVRDALRALPAPTRELAVALATRAGEGPVLLPGPPAGPVLVVAPHPDDEVIGPGGALARHVDAGHDVTVLLLTSGGATAAGGRDVTAAREAESRRALAHLGGRIGLRLARLPDGDLAGHREAVVDAIGRHAAGAACVYAPSLLDPHPDHVVAARAVAATELPDDVLVLGYEVWAPGPVTALLDVTDVFARKQAALAEYHVALRTVDYVRSASGLAAYRSVGGMLGGRGFAEGFTALPLGELRGLLAGA
jgi:LmbE family N-acetylglucosaminyl deacetylase